MQAEALILSLADAIARHAVPLLLALGAALLAVVWFAWRLIERFAPRFFALVARAGRLLDRRRLVARYLGLHALLAFALAAGGTVAFFELAENIGAGEALAAFDLALAAALQRHLDDSTLAAFGLLTRLGDPGFLLTIVMIVTAVLVFRGERLLATAWIAITLGGTLLNQLLKAIFERSRPIHDHGWAPAAGFSFPSGHASGALLVYGTLVYLIVRHAPRRWHLSVAALGLILAVTVGAM